MLIIVITSLKTITVQLYIDSMDLIPSKPKTMGGIGQELFGKGGLLFVTSISSFNFIAFTICYLIVLGKIMASWCVDVFALNEESIFA